MVSCIKSDALIYLGNSQASAMMSADLQYRYKLVRRWNDALARVIFVMLNPSTADHTVDDPTIRKCLKFAKAWGYGSLEVLNLFAFRATDPKMLKRTNDPVGRMNREILMTRCFDPEIKLVVCAWGRGGELLQRGYMTAKDLVEGGRDLHALKLSEKTFEPYHPLYLRDDTTPFLWKMGDIKARLAAQEARTK